MATATARKTDTAPVTQGQFAAFRNTIDRLLHQSEQSDPGAQRGEGATAPRGSRLRSTKGQRPMTDTTQAQATPPANPNAITLAQMLVVASELGAQEAQGKDVQVKFDLKVLEAAFVGAIDLTKNKHGDGIDDSAKLSEAYFKGRNASVIFDHKEPKQRKLMSTTRTMVKLGSSPKFGVGQPMQIVNDLMTLRQNLRRTANKGTKLDDAHNTLMRFAREQLKRDTVIDDTDELKQFCYRSEADPREAQGVIKGWLTQAIKLRDGKLPNCSDLDNSAEITTIINACNRRLSAIAKAKGASTNPQTGV